jgi:hypothetical protein
VCSVGVWHAWRSRRVAFECVPGRIGRPITLRIFLIEQGSPYLTICPLNSNICFGVLKQSSISVFLLPFIPLLSPFLFLGFFPLLGKGKRGGGS